MRSGAVDGRAHDRSVIVLRPLAAAILLIIGAIAFLAIVALVSPAGHFLIWSLS